MEEKAEPEFTDEEARDVKNFFKGAAGKKLLETLDIRCANKNNLLQTVNLISDSSDFGKVGQRCSLIATEVRTYMDIADFFKTVGEQDAH